MRREPIARPGAAVRGRQRRRVSPQEAAKRIERDVDRLAASIDKFRIDAQRFFAGDLPQPPDELRDRILAHLRRLRARTSRGRQ